TAVRFGDGATAARLPTGRSNVTARYRVGSGLVGRVAATQLRTAIRPLVGVQTVTNPLPAEGGADPEPAGTERVDAPRSVRTLGRAVSLRDIEDLVTESGLVAKSQ